MNSPEFDDLLDTYFLGSVAADQRARLDEALRSDRDCRRSFVEAVLFEARLYAAVETSAVESWTVGASAGLGSVDAAVRESKASPHLTRRLQTGLRRFDLTAAAIMVAVLVVGICIVQVGRLPREKNAPESAPAGGEIPAREVKPGVTPQRTEGLIKSLDAAARTFVLVLDGRNRATFYVSPASGSEQDSTRILLDGRPATFEEAIQVRCKAAVVFEPDGDGRSRALRVEVSSE